MSVIYDSCSIIPAPLVTIEKEYQRDGAGEKIGSLYQIQLHNKIVLYRGSPRVGTGTLTGFGDFAINGGRVVDIPTMK
jgi:hypothetical protein